MTAALEWLGHLHPVLIHFPIALAWIGVFAEATRIGLETDIAGRAVAWAVCGATGFAFAAATSGWILAAHEHIRSDQLEALQWHRWIGVSATIVLAASAFAAVRWRTTSRSGLRWLRRLLVWTSAVLITIGSHMGASIVWGDDWLF